MLPITKPTTPTTSSSSSDNHPVKKPPKTPPDHHHHHHHQHHQSIIIFKSFPLSLPSFPFFSPRSTCLILSLLTLQLLLLTFSHLLPSSSHHHPLISASAPIQTSSPVSSQCDHGKFFVYDLPSTFNLDIYTNCDSLSPWGSRCLALSNSGFGAPALGIEPLIPSNLSHAWYWTDQFSVEIIFHNRMLHHECRTLDPASASAFYIPFYAGLAVGKYLWSDYTPQQRDHHCELMLSWLERELPYFNKSNGWDHFLTMGRITWDFRRSGDQDWGSRCIYLPSMRNITRLLIERNPWDYFDVGVPYPTGFHPDSKTDLVTWQDFVLSRARRTLFCFAGGTRGLIKNDFRALLLSQCRDSGRACRVVDCAGTKCANGTSSILETFLDSDFCLQPRGDSFTRRSIFDCMVAGSIPVFFWHRTAYYQYEWFLPGEPESYSVFIHRDEVKNGTSIKSVLEKYSKEEVARMREKVVGIIPKIIYAKPNEGLKGVKDAVDIAVDGVLRRIQEQRHGYKW